MLPFLCASTNLSVPVLLILAAMATQRSVAYAQSQGDNYNPYYYWLSPGRIVGIAVGAVALVFLILSMLIFACRRRRAAKASSRVVVSNYSAAGAHPPAFPSPSWQEAQQTSPGPGATNMGWYYPTQSGTPSYQAKSTAYSDQAQRSPHSERVPSAAPISEVQRTPTSDQVQGPAPRSQEQRIAPPGQVQSAASVPSGQAQTISPPSQPQRTATIGQAQRISPPSQAQRTAPTTGQAQGTTLSGQTQSNARLGRTQEQGAPPPRDAYTRGAPSAGAANGRDQSPPPYSLTGPPAPPAAAHTVR